MRKHFSLLLAAFATCLSGWAATTYEIGSASDLEAFAAKVNAGETDACAVLTADIDLADVTHTPIGTADWMFCGTIDGQYHTISNLNNMLCGTIDGATLTKIIVASGEIKDNTEYAPHTGVFAGTCGTSKPNTISYCISGANVVTSTGDTSGFVGKMYGTIENCAFTGTLKAVTSTGAFIGSDYGAAPLNATVKNCFVLSNSIQSDAYLGAICGWQDSGSFDNIFVCCPTHVNFGRESGTNTNLFSVSADQMASGEVAFRLNGDQSNIVWYQNIGEDPMPTLDSTHKQVYAVGEMRCDGTPLGTIEYSNTPSTIPAHEFEEGFCTVCGQAQVDYCEMDADGYYLIGDLARLEWFAKAVNAGTLKNGKMKLTADIDFGDVEHTPIGTPSKMFSGIIDGQFHKLSNLNNMLCGTIDGATLTRIIVESGTITENTAYAAHTGVFAGTTVQGSTPNTISYCLSGANVVNSAGSNDTGGFVGKMYGTIEYCGFTGTLQGTTSLGAFIGSDNGDSPYVTTVKNCFVISESMTSDQYTGALCGWQNGGGVFVNVVVCAPNNTELFGHAGGGAENVVTMTVDQFASGEATYLMNGYDWENAKWFQTLGEDALPTLDATHKVVYAQGDLNCDGTAKSGELVYNNEGGSTRPDHEYEDGICVNCGQADLGFVQVGEDGFYELATAGNLEWFAKKVNKGETGLKARLVADIDLEDMVHTPIGSAGNPFKGTIDGQFHSISNLNNMLCGTIDGATLTRIIVASGEITDNTEYAVHTGVFAGNCTSANPSTITYCLSGANIVNTAGSNDTGGFVGKMYGTIENCGFTGTLQGTTSIGAFIGSDYGDSPLVTAVKNCFVFSESITSDAYTGALCGWQAGGSFTNIYVCVPNTAALFGHESGTNTNIYTVNSDQMENGEVCYKMNGESFLNPIWFQTLGNDAAPTPDSSHGLVYKSGPEEYASQYDDATLAAMAKFIVSEASSYTEDLIATKTLIDEYQEALDNFGSYSTREELQQAYKGIEVMRKNLEKSKAGYDVYLAKIADINVYVQEHSELGGEKFDFLMDYLESEIEPGEEMPNGSYVYITTNMLLSGSQAQAEAAFAQQLLENAIAGDIRTGADVTQLLHNADFKEGNAGWLGNTGSIGTKASPNTDILGVEVWNANFDAYQTLSNLQNGVYVLSMTSGFRPGNPTVTTGSLTSSNYASCIYANENMTYMPTTIETMISVEDAVEGENCNIAGDVPDLQITDDTGETLLGYIMHGMVSVANAAKGGRAMTYILANVTDGTLTVGLKNPGTGQPYDWTGWANIHLTYAGTLEEASEALDQTLAGQTDRAKTMLDYQYSIGTDYAVYPNFSQELKDQLTAEIAEAETADTPEAKYALIQKMSQTFSDIYACKQAYIKMLSSMESLYAVACDLQDADAISTEDFAATEDLNNRIWEGYENGTISLADAQSCDEINNSPLYPTYDENGVLQINNSANFMFFCQKVKAGDTHLNAVMNADVNLCTADQMLGDYFGVFDGQYHTLTVNINREADDAAFIEYLNGTVKNLIVRGTITTTAKYAAGIAAHSYAGSSLNNIQSYVDIISSIEGDGTHAGLVAVAEGTTVISNSLFAGTMTGSATTCCGGIVGWASAAVTMNNVLQIGDIQVNGEGSSTFSRNNGNLTCNNCYYKTLFTAVKSSGTTQVTDDQLISGEVCYNLNGGTAPNAYTVWTQLLGVDVYPMPQPTRLYFVDLVDGGYTNVELQEDDKVALITDASQLSSNASDSAEGTNIGALIDGDAATFWHTDWHGECQDQYHYLQVELPALYSGEITTMITRRSASNDHPTKMKVWASTDGEEFTELTTIDLPFTGAGSTVFAEPFAISTPVKYLRFAAVDCIGDSYSFRTFWHAAEFQLYGVAGDGIDGIQSGDKTADGIFNLMGQKVQKAQKGIYIMDGKKVLVK